MSVPSTELPPRWSGIQDRLPARLEDLHGPEAGTVCVPLHIAWSGLREFDVSRDKLRMSLYALVLTEGRAADVAAYVHPELLRRDWPVLRTFLGRRLRQAWEQRFILPAAA